MQRCTSYRMGAGGGGGLGWGWGGSRVGVGVRGFRVGWVRGFRVAGRLGTIGGPRAKCTKKK